MSRSRRDLAGGAGGSHWTSRTARGGSGPRSEFLTVVCRALMDVSRGHIRGACGTMCGVGAVGLGWAPPSSVPTRVGCARVWWAYALGEDGRREGRSSGGGCSSTPSPRRGVVAVNRRVALPPPARRAGLPVVPAGWVSRHARIDHPPVTLPSPMLVVKLTVCGSSAPENVAVVRVPPPLRPRGRFLVTWVGRSRLSRTEPE